MSDSLKADVLKAVQSNAPAKNDVSVKLKDPQVLQHSLDGALKLPQTLNENIFYDYYSVEITFDSFLGDKTRFVYLTQDEMKHLNELKEGKDECLIRLSEEIKNAGGNGVIDLKIKYILNGLGGSSFQIIASGMGIKIRAEPLAS